MSSFRSTNLFVYIELVVFYLTFCNNGKKRQSMSLIRLRLCPVFWFACYSSNNSLCWVYINGIVLIRILNYLEISGFDDRFCGGFLVGFKVLVFFLENVSFLKQFFCKNSCQTDDGYYFLSLSILKIFFRKLFD